MHIHSIKIENFRNISCILDTFSCTFNAFHGNNASGKTSILEAIYYLSSGKSLRGASGESLIKHNQSHFTLFSEISDHQSLTPIGISRSQEGNTAIRLHGDTVRSISAVSQLLPMVDRKS